MSGTNGEAGENGKSDVGEAEEGKPAEAKSGEKSPLELMTAERDKLKDQLLRTAADFDNFRKRTRRDLEDALRRGKEDVVREFLPVGDNLERAVAAAGNAKDAQALVDGVKMVLKLLQDGLERVGVTRVPTVGERFDPTVHEAIQQIETNEHPVGAIVSELVAGYKMGERLVRAAMVAVARPASGKASETPPESK